MPATTRPELDPLVENVKRMRYSRLTEGGQMVWGVKEIRDLRPQERA